MKICREIPGIEEIEELGTNLLLLKNCDYDYYVARKDTLELLYTDLNICDIISKSYDVDADLEYSYSVDFKTYVTLYKYLKNNNIALIGKVAKSNYFKNITKDNTLNSLCNRVLYTPINLKDGSFLYENAWYEYWDYSRDTKNVIFVRSGEHKGYYLILNKKDGSIIDDKCYIKKYYPLPENQDRIYKLILDDDTVMLFDVYTGKYITDIFNLSDVTYLFNYYIFTFTDGLKRIATINSDLSIKLELDYLLDCTEFDGNFLITQFPSKLLTVISRKTLKPLYEDKKFLEWIWFSENYYLVKNLDHLYTLINKKDGSYVYENVWFLKWEKFWEDTDDNYYIVTREDGLKSLFNKKTGKLQYPKAWYKEWKVLDEKYYIVYSNEFPLSTLFDKKTGKIIQENVWHKDWFTFDDDKYLVRDTYTDYPYIYSIISKDTFTEINPNLRFNAIKKCPISDDYYITQKFIDYKNSGDCDYKLIKKSDLSIILESGISFRSRFIPISNDKMFIIDIQKCYLVEL